MFKVARNICKRNFSRNIRRRYASKTGKQVINFESYDRIDKPLMKMVPSLVFGESGKFASYYWLYANQNQALNNVEQDFEKILKIKQSKNDFAVFKTLIYSTALSAEERSARIVKPTSNITFSPTTQTILTDLCHKDRQSLIWAIIDDFKDLMKAHRLEVDVAIVLPHVPDPDYFELLLAKIQNEYLPPNAKINLAIEVDENVSGGYKVRVGHNVYDNSWNSDLSRVTEADDIRVGMKKFDTPYAHEIELPTTEEIASYVSKSIEKLVSERLSFSGKVDPTLSLLSKLEGSLGDANIEKNLVD